MGDFCLDNRPLPDDSSCVDSTFTSRSSRKVAANSKVAAVGAIEEEVSASSRNERVAGTVVRPVHTSAVPKDTDKAEREAFATFKRIAVLGSPKKALRYVDSLSNRKTFLKKYASKVAAMTGFYGRRFLDANDFDCSRLHRARKASRIASVPFVVKASKCDGCIHRNCSACGLFGSKLVSSSKETLPTKEEASKILKHCSRSDELKKLAQSKPVTALQLFYVSDDVD